MVSASGRAALILLSGLFVCASESRAEQQLQLGPETLVASDTRGDIVEPHLAASRTNPLHLVGAAMVVLSPDLETIDCTIMTSFDGGLSWTRHDLGLQTCGDPWVLITEAGSALVSVLSEGGIRVYRSEDGGQTWPDPPVLIPGAHDRESIIGGRSGVPIQLVSGVSIRGPSGAPRSGVFVASSRDDGRTFQRQSQTIVSNLSYEAQTPVITADGDLLIPFQDHHRWSGARLSSRRSWLLAPDSSGGEFGAPRLIDEGCNRVGPVGWPTLAMITEGARLGRLFWACEAEDARGIRVTYSDDEGESWTDPTVIPSDLDERFATKIPTMASDSMGRMLLAWVARDRNPPSCSELVAALSRDGDDSFSTPLPISTQRSCPAETDVAGRFGAGGDYLGLAHTSDGEFVFLWSDAREGRFHLYSRRLSVTNQ